MPMRILLLCLLLALPAQAANHYIRQGGTASLAGASACSTDWNTANACAQIPTTLVRGDTYYVAAGTYTGYSFTTARSGGTLITIKKATVLDHGASGGWFDFYATGQAIFSSPLRWVADTGFWLIDGVTGGGPGSWQTGHGFRVNTTTAAPALDFQGDTGTASDITVRHTEIVGTNDTSGGGSRGQDGVACSHTNGSTRLCSNLTFSYLYSHDMGRTHFFAYFTPNMIVEYSAFGRYNSTPAAHSELISDNASGDIDFRYNLVTHVEGTGALMWDNSASAGHTAQFRIYGNVFYRAVGDNTWDFSNGVIGGWTGGGGEDCFNLRVYNNTFINVRSATFANEVFGIGNMQRFGNNIAQNNLFYNDSSIGFGASPITSHDYNHMINSGGTQGEPNGTSAVSGNPFVDMVNLDFRLTAQTANGLALAAPYNVDMLGNTRGTGGVWTRGALQFGASPAAPVNLRIVP